jgi:hypothetical protein
VEQGPHSHLIRCGYLVRCRAGVAISLPAHPPSGSLSETRTSNKARNIACSRRAMQKTSGRTGGLQGLLGCR